MGPWLQRHHPFPPDNVCNALQCGLCRSQALFDCIMRLRFTCSVFWSGVRKDTDAEHFRDYIRVSFHTSRVPKGWFVVPERYRPQGRRILRRLVGFLTAHCVFAMRTRTTPPDQCFYRPGVVCVVWAREVQNRHVYVSGLYKLPRRKNLECPARSK